MTMTYSIKHVSRNYMIYTCIYIYCIRSASFVLQRFLKEKPYFVIEQCIQCRISYGRLLLIHVYIAILFYKATIL